MATIASVPDFKPFKTRFSAANLAALAEHGTVKGYSKHAILIHEGERGDELFILLEGRVQVFLADHNGREIILNTQGPGHVFGEMVLDGAARSASVKAIEKCRVSRVSREAFRDFLESTPSAALELIDVLMQRVRMLTQSVGDLALLDVYGRVAKLLLELATEVDGSQLIRAPPTQQEIGSRVGCSREMVSRIFKGLRAGGYLETYPRYWVIVRQPPARW